MITTFSGRLGNVKVLLSAKPDIEARDKRGRTAADHARECKPGDITEVIEEAGDG